MTREERKAIDAVYDRYLASTPLQKVEAIVDQLAKDGHEPEIETVDDTVPGAVNTALKISEMMFLVAKGLRPIPDEAKEVNE